MAVQQTTLVGQGCLLIGSYWWCFLTFQRGNSAFPSSRIVYSTTLSSNSITTTPANGMGFAAWISAIAKGSKLIKFLNWLWRVWLFLQGPNSGSHSQVKIAAAPRNKEVSTADCCCGAGRHVAFLSIIAALKVILEQSLLSVCQDKQLPWGWGRPAVEWSVVLWAKCTGFKWSTVLCNMVMTLALGALHRTRNVPYIASYPHQVFTDETVFLVFVS